MTAASVDYVYHFMQLIKNYSDKRIDNTVSPSVKYTAVQKSGNFFQLTVSDATSGEIYSTLDVIVYPHAS